MTISKEEAAQALRDVEASRRAMHQAIRTHRGHLYLWLWGSVFIAVALVNWLSGEKYWVEGNWISAAGVAATILISWVQGRRIRSRTDMRFVSVCITLLVFGYVIWPTFLGLPH